MLNRRRAAPLDSKSVPSLTHHGTFHGTSINDSTPIIRWHDSCLETEQLKWEDDMLLSLITTALAQDLEGVGSAGSVENPDITTNSQAVVGGSQVGAGDWPETAAVYFGGEVGCTGVLIAPNAVLSAGHCTGGITSVKLNTNDYSQGGERIAVADVIEYPDSQRTYDLAILILEEESSVEPAIIAQDCVLEDLSEGAEVTIVGYGALDPQGYEYSTELMEGFTTIDDPECTNLSSGCAGAVSPGGELGAGGRDEVDSCYGDSGGPLYLNTDRGDYLVGITSRGYNTSWDCGSGGIYVRPDAVMDWLEENIGENLPAPECGGTAGEGEDAAPGNDGSGEGREDEMWATGCSHAPGSTGWLVALLAMTAPLIRRR